MEGDEVVYRIDRHDRIVFLNQAWDEFALANGGESLAANSVLETRLWDFMDDPETLYLHQALVRRVREGRNIRGLAFRCDSPGLRRFMTMDLELLADDMVEYRCRLVRSECREPVAVPPAGNGTGPLLRMCGWCQRVQDGSGEWTEIERTFELLELVGAEHGVTITHGICHRCLHDVLWQSAGAKSKKIQSPASLSQRTS